MFSYHLAPQNFDYEITVSFIVPEAWLPKALPDLNGTVEYGTRHRPPSQSEMFLFAIDEVSRETSAAKTFQLSLRDKGKPLLNSPILIHLPSDDAQLPDAEIVLLNHILSAFMISASMGNNYLDFSDVIEFFKKSPEFELRVGASRSLPALLPIVSKENASFAFAVLYSNPKNMQLSNLVDLSRHLADFGRNDGLVLLTDVAVEQNLMLLSVMYARLTK